MISHLAECSSIRCWISWLCELLRFTVVYLVLCISNLVSDSCCHTLADVSFSFGKREIVILTIFVNGLHKFWLKCEAGLGHFLIQTFGYTYIGGEWLAVRGDWFYFHFLIDFNGFRTAPTCSPSRPFSSQWTPSFASKSWGDSLMEWKQISANYKWADTRSASSSSKPWF